MAWRQAIIWSNDALGCRRIYASFGLNEVVLDSSNDKQLPLPKILPCPTAWPVGYILPHLTSRRCVSVPRVAIHRARIYSVRLALHTWNHILAQPAFSLSSTSLCIINKSKSLLMFSNQSYLLQTLCNPWEHIDPVSGKTFVYKSILLYYITLLREYTISIYTTYTHTRVYSLSVLYKEYQLTSGSNWD